MSRWFRMYEEVLDDPKVQLLPPAQFKMWVNMLALTSRNNGSLPSVKDCAFAFRVTENTVSEALSEFENLGLVSHKGETFRPHNWDKRQYKSDTSTPRVKRFRKRSRNANETASEADTEADTDKVSPKGEPGPLEPDLIVVAVGEWNALADDCGLARVERMNDSRRRHLRIRLGECGGLDGWKLTLQKIKGSPFLLGENDRGWKADFDFLLQPKSFTKLMEGGYERAKPTAKAFNGTDRLAEQLRSIGVGLPDRAGPLESFGDFADGPVIDQPARSH